MPKLPKAKEHKVKNEYVHGAESLLTVWEDSQKDPKSCGSSLKTNSRLVVFHGASICVYCSFFCLYGCVCLFFDFRVAGFDFDSVCPSILSSSGASRTPPLPPIHLLHLRFLGHWSSSSTTGTTVRYYSSKPHHPLLSLRR